MGAGGGGLGQRLVISGPRVSGAPAPRASARLWLPSSPLPGVARIPLLRNQRGGGGGCSRSAGPGPPGGCPASLVISHPPLPAARDHCRRARPPPAPPLVWGLGLRRRRVPPAVAPVGEGRAQALREPVAGLRVRDAEHPPPPSRKAGHVGSLSGHPAQITARRTLLWSSWATHPLGGTSWFPPSLRRSTASEGRFLIPPVVPDEAQPSHPYTSVTGGGPLPPRGSGIASKSRAQSPRVPSAPVPAPAPAAPAQRHAPLPPGEVPSSPAPPSALVPRERGRAGRRRAGGGPADMGVQGVGGG